MQVVKEEKYAGEIVKILDGLFCHRRIFKNWMEILGKILRVGVSLVFYKKLPTEVIDKFAQQFYLSASTYKEHFCGRDQSLTDSQVRVILLRHPELDASNVFMDF